MDGGHHRKRYKATDLSEVAGMCIRWVIDLLARPFKKSSNLKIMQKHRFFKILDIISIYKVKFCYFLLISVLTTTFEYATALHRDKDSDVRQSSNQSLAV